MFSVMRLQADDQIVLVFDDGIKRLARVGDSQSQSVEIIEELADNVELPVSVTIAMGFPKGDKLEFVAQRQRNWAWRPSGPSQRIGLWSNGTVKTGKKQKSWKNCPRRDRAKQTQSHSSCSLV